jgi:hypothetical protein
MIEFIQKIVLYGAILIFIVYGIKLFLEKTNFSLENVKAFFYSYPVDTKNKKRNVRRAV